MFTGIIQEIGRVRSKTPSASGTTFVVELSATSDLKMGDSIAFNGVCQTVEVTTTSNVSFTAVGETLRKTTFDGLKTGSVVNVERSATPTTALGGHIVQGHVDGVATIRSFVRRGKDRLLVVNLPETLRELAVAKGSIAIDGVSLTIIDADDDVSATIIPFTIEHTIMNTYRTGTRVNVEMDIIGKYVMSYLQRFQHGESADLKSMFQQPKG